MYTLHTPVSLMITKNKSEQCTKLSITLLFCCFIILAGINPITAKAEPVAGFVNGDLSVGSDGSANYSVPIGVPPGVAGMQPKLSVNYNSNGGNGLLGVGFSLGGMSAITRCPATHVQDGFKGGVYFDDRDRYCMDGQRLIAISGADGAAGTEYRTEIDGFSRIISYGQQGNGPAYWEVSTKSGQTLVYGNSDDSRVERTGYPDVRTWAVNSISDAVENVITFSYYEDNINGEHYPVSVDYAGNSVRFEYRQRPDPVYSYQGGGKLSMTKHLTSITLYGAGTKVQEYSLSYLQGKKSLLGTIIHKDANANTMPTLTFDWVEGSIDQPERFPTFQPSSSSVGQNYYSSHIQCIYSSGIICDMRDMNGDGLLDRVVNEYLTETEPFARENAMRVSLNNGSGYAPSTVWINSGGVLASIQYKDGQGVKLDLIDMDGDGRPDRVAKENYSGGGAGIHVAHNNGHGFDAYQQWLAPGMGQQQDNLIQGHTGSDLEIYSDMRDMDGDGLPDYVIHHNYRTNTPGIHVALNNGHGFGAFALWLPAGSGQPTNNYIQGRNGDGIYSDLRDMNGDGLPDQVTYKNYKTNTLGIHVALNNGHGFQPYTLWLPHGSGQHTNDYIRGSNGDGIYSDLLDMNGDGLPDQVSHKNYATGAQGIHVALNNGQGFEPYTLWLSSINGRYTDNYIQSSNAGGIYSDLRDINGDGLPDQVVYENTATNTPGMYVALNNGHGFEPYELLLPDDGSTGNFIQVKTVHGIYADLSDFNGDGVADRTKATGGYINHTVTPQIVGITAQPNHYIGLTYKTLADSSVYTNGVVGGYPGRGVFGTDAMRVVSEVTNPDGLGGTLSTSYQYGDLKINLRGRGSLGFAWMQSTDNQTGIATKTEYSQIFPNVGQVTRTKQKLPNGLTLGETTASVNYLITHQGTGGVDEYSGQSYGSVYFPYSGQVIETHNDLDGSWMSTTTTDNVYDDPFGSPTHITITTQDSEDTVIQETMNEYINDTGNWHLGRLIRTSVIHINAQGSITRTSAFEYNPDGLLSREIIEPDNPELRLQTDYQYDSFGNKTLVTISGQGIVARSSSTAYSPDGRFPVTVTNALGHTETRTYDPALGVMTQLIGPNGLPTTWQYDGFGRKIREDRADGTWTTIARGMCDGFYCPEDAPLGTYLYTITETSGSTPVAEYSDQLGRVVRKVTTGFDGTLVYRDTEYNHLGQISRTSQPYFKGEASRWASSEYDLLGRVKKVTTQGPSGSIHNTFSYSGYTTTATDAMDHVKVTKKNAQGKVLRVDEEEGGWVTYRYDAIGNLLETNANGVITTLTYDDRDRKTAMDDPDMGQWTYVYDVLGNLTSQTDAKGQIISMVYDKLGRMVQRTEPEGVTTWIYDAYDTVANGIAPHSIGKLIQVDAPDGYQQIVTYDNLGRASTTTTTADGKTLTISTQYDNFGRVSRTIRPEGFVVENAYNAQGYLEAVRTPAALIGDYDALHLSQVWSEIEQPLIAELEQAQQRADELYAQAAVYRERAQYYWDTAQLLQEQAPNKQFLKDDRKATIAELQQTSTSLNQLATQLEQKAAEYQLLANSILSLMPTNWQANWFLDAKVRYDQYARNAIAKIEAAYQINENTLVWTPIDVGGITIFIQAKPSFRGADAITAQEKQYLEEIGNWEAETASLLRILAESVRAQQAARDKYQTALVNHPTMVWAPIDVDGITTLVQVATGPLTPEQVLTVDELQLYNAPDLLQTDGITLTEFYINRAMEQVALQREVEEQRDYYARTASRLSQTIAAYSDAIAQLQGTESQITFWHATGRDAAGRLTSSVVGNGLETRNFYDQATGQLTYITSGFGSSTPVRELSYKYDSLNNVTSRVDRVLGMSETFLYDRQDRLTHSFVQGQIGGVDYNRSVDYSYDAMGNILNKSDVGDYSYGDLNRSSGNAGPHALVSAGPLHAGYQYDNNGNMLQGGGRDIIWSSFNKPIEFSKDGVFQAGFKYGPDRARYLKITQDSRTLYLGKSYERIETGTKIEHKHLIYADGEVVAIHVKTTDNAIAQLDKTRYLHRDSLGSIDTITDGQGHIVDRLSYEPFGARRDGDWRVGASALYIPTLTNRGFTGHEHVDEMGLIHMNGRVYDPQLGRFLSADPTMQFPHQSQGYNRYSYVQNNPLKYTDPSGFSFFGDIFNAIGNMLDAVWRNPIIRMAAAIYLAAVIGPWATNFFGSAWIGGAVAGFASGGVMSGTWEGALKGAFYGAISGGIANEIGHGWGHELGWSDTTKTLAHGITQGAITNARGGKFKSGFIGAFVGHAVGGPIQKAMRNASVEARTVMAAMVGGFSSALGGGKFASGALSAAFTHMFNKEWVNEQGNRVSDGDADKSPEQALRDARGRGDNTVQLTGRSMAGTSHGEQSYYNSQEESKDAVLTLSVVAMIPGPQQLVTVPLAGIASYATNDYVGVVAAVSGVGAIRYSGSLMGVCMDGASYGFSGYSIGSSNMDY